MTTRERVIQAVLDLPEEELDGIYDIIVTRRGKRRSVQEALAGLAELRKADPVVTDAAVLVRKSREELDQRVESHLSQR